VKAALRLLLLLGFAAIGLFVFREVPRNVSLVYALDDAGVVRRVVVEVFRGDTALRQAEFRFPTGAPAQIRQDVKLTDGQYRVVVRVWRLNGAPRRAVLPVTVAEGGPIVLAVHDVPERDD
jgi:hypothetical protein